MISVANAVENIISESPFLKELISLDVINLSGLARQMKNSIEEKTQKQVTEGSILVALKRLAEKTEKKPHVDYTIFKIIPELTVRSNLFEITVKNSTNLIDKQKKLLEHAKLFTGNYVNFTYGLSETTTVFSSQMYKKVLEIYKDEKILSEVKNIATLSISFPKEIADAPFTYYTILRALAWSGISIIEMISTYSELIIVLEQNDIELAFSLIRRLFVTKI